MCSFWSNINASWIIPCNSLFVKRCISSFSFFSDWPKFHLPWKCNSDSSSPQWFSLLWTWRPWFYTKLTIQGNKWSFSQVHITHLPNKLSRAFYENLKDILCFALYIHITYACILWFPNQSFLSYWYLCLWFLLLVIIKHS